MSKLVNKFARWYVKLGTLSGVVAIVVTGIITSIMIKGMLLISIGKFLPIVFGVVLLLSGFGILLVGFTVITRACGLPKEKDSLVEEVPEHIVNLMVPEMKPLKSLQDSSDEKVDMQSLIDALTVISKCCNEHDGDCHSCPLKAEGYDCVLEEKPMFIGIEEMRGRLI